MQDFKFQIGEHGKPMLDTKGLPRRIREFDFNITHTDGLIGLAVAAGAKVGIDCERIDRTLRSRAERIAGKMFSEAEQQELLRALPVSPSASAFSTLSCSTCPGVKTSVAVHTTFSAIVDTMLPTPFSPTPCSQAALTPTEPITDPLCRTT